MAVHSEEDLNPKAMADGASKARELPFINSEELARHNSSADLWVAIHGKVYDVSKWAEIHPGGDLPLTTMAGQDVTDAFLAFHPARAWSFLLQFHVATLTDDNVKPLAAEQRKLLNDFNKAGLMKNPLHIYLLIAAIIVCMFSTCITGVLLSGNVWIHLGCAILLGLVWSQSGWIGHDLGHCGMVGNPKIDNWIGLLAGNCLSGIGIGWWKRNHNAHHFSCNSVEYDPDLQYLPIFAVSSRFFSSLYSYFYERKMDFDRPARWLISYQHWTFYLVMAVARVNLFGQSIALLLSKRHVPNRRLELIGIAFFWTWFSWLLAHLPSTGERLGFVLVSFAVTGIQHVQFCLNHFSSPVYEGCPKSKNWAESQVRGTLNLSTPPWLDWFHGGLQFQIEHHLFPRLPRHNLRKISVFVRPLCEKYGLPYKSVTFWEANVMIIETLKAAAMEARDLSKPVPTLSKSLLWEAFNSHG
ncbi:hypothetical protein O6H91_04G035700 [Diphasiastrum complanatum]|uniref:Uncharacterized protein n=1 Tax=Diphasiastrum complanatum TaxID=34168 RepID=A0ACC2DVR0_DIPCM|nr:hypothetical protein O6H91_Y439500 [Diphasiastrum complanatum]KAJ7558359.1 hypothetical protein O6H91_04G035700 [Diphasiastrum complanatum]